MVDDKDTPPQDCRVLEDRQVPCLDSFAPFPTPGS